MYMEIRQNKENYRQSITRAELKKISKYDVPGFEKAARIAWADLIDEIRLRGRRKNIRAELPEDLNKLRAMAKQHHISDEKLDEELMRVYCVQNQLTLEN